MTHSERQFHIFYDRGLDIFVKQAFNKLVMRRGFWLGALAFCRPLWLVQLHAVIIHGTTIIEV